MAFPPFLADWHPGALGKPPKSEPEVVFADLGTSKEGAVAMQPRCVILCRHGQETGSYLK